MFRKEQEEMVPSQRVLDKIRREERNHPFNEFGGWLIVNDKGVIIDIVFDIEFQSGGSVDFGTAIVKLDKAIRKQVRGWFHKHPITGLSSTDKEAVRDLTEFWKECYTMVLQSTGKMLMIKSVWNPGKGEEAVEEKKEEINVFNEVKEDEVKPKGYELKEDRDEYGLPKLEVHEKDGSDVKGIENPLPDKDDQIEHTGFFSIFKRKYAKNKLGELNDQQEENVKEFKDKAKKHHTYYQWTPPRILKDTEFIFEKEIPFGITNFTPTITNNIKGFVLYIPKLKCASTELTHLDLITLESFHFHSSNKNYNISRPTLKDYLEKGKMVILSCTGYLDMDSKLLFEGDKVEYQTPYDLDKRIGTVTLNDGEWSILRKKRLNKESVDFKERVVVRKVGDATQEVK